MNTKKLYKGIDLFKLGAALGVVALHTGIKGLNVLGHLSVPFFVIISSFFFFKHYFKLDNTIERKKYIQKFLTRLGLLFVTWEVFYIPFAIERFIKITGDRVTLKSIGIYIFDFFYPVPSQANGWVTSWYIIAMFMGLPILLGVFYLLRKNWIILGIICVTIEVYYILANGYAYLTHWSNEGTYAFPRILIYIYLGMIIAKFLNKIINYSFKRYLYLFGVLLILFLAENFIISKLGGVYLNEEVFTTAPTAFVGSILAIKWQPNVGNTVNIRNFSTFLYCAQQWGLNIWNMNISIETLNINLLVLSLIKFFFIVISSFIFYLLYKYVKNKTQWKFWNYMV